MRAPLPGGSHLLASPASATWNPPSLQLDAWAGLMEELRASGLILVHGGAHAKGLGAVPVT